MRGMNTAQPALPLRFAREGQLAALLAVSALAAVIWVKPSAAQSSDGIAFKLVGDWRLDREATEQRLSEQASGDAPAELPPFELNLQFKDDNKVTADVVVGGTSQTRSFRWRVLEEPSDAAALIEFLPTNGLPRRHKFRLLSSDRLALDAQGAAHTLILVRHTE
jgi:hypothetical protein